MKNSEIRKSVYLERIKSHLVQILGVKDVDKWLKENVFNLDLQDLTPKQARVLHERIKKELKGIYQGNVEKLKEELAELFEMTYEREQEQVQAYVTKQIENKTLDVGALFFSPLGYKGVTGMTLDEVFTSLSEAESKRVADSVRLAHFQGKTTAELVRTVRGTKAGHFQDGLLNISKRNAEAIVRTSTAIVSSEAKQAFINDNKDLITGIQVIATLDGRTSATCRSLDGQIMKLDEAIFPPYHFNCRSSFIYIFEDGFIKPKYRASMNGRTENVTYYEWLKTQSPEFQDEVLGKARGKLFRDGGLTIEQFKALKMDKNFKPMTLEQMRQKEPLAFNEAFNKPSKVNFKGITPREHEVQRLISQGVRPAEARLADKWQQHFNVELVGFDGRVHKFIKPDNPADLVKVDLSLKPNQWQTLDIMYALEDKASISDFLRSFNKSDVVWERSKNKIIKHVQKADIVPMYMQYFDKDTAEKIQNFVLELDVELRKKIVFIWDK